MSDHLTKLLQNNKGYQARFDKPRSLGAKQKLAVVACMDSRLMLSDMLGVGLGDIEMIRNAGGRITLDVLRSLTVACEIKELACTDVFIIHHTDCGGMAAVREHDQLISTMADRLGMVLGNVLKLLAQLGLDSLFLQPITDLDKSVQQDVDKLAHAALIPDTVGIYGFAYSTENGSLREVARREPKGRAAIPKDWQALPAAAAATAAKE